MARRIGARCLCWAGSERARRVWEEIKQQPGAEIGNLARSYSPIQTGTIFSYSNQFVRRLKNAEGSRHILKPVMSDVIGYIFTRFFFFRQIE